jgi:hypothetical protein
MEISSGNLYIFIRPNQERLRKILYILYCFIVSYNVLYYIILYSATLVCPCYIVWNAVRTALWYHIVIDTIL